MRVWIVGKWFDDSVAILHRYTKSYKAKRSYKAKWNK